MADFAEAISDDRAGRRLARAIQGRGAFRRFRDELHEEHPDLVPAWYAFVQRDRPAETLPDVILRGQSAAHGLSCPSGHAMVIFAITALVAPYFKGW